MSKSWVWAALLHTHTHTHWPSMFVDVRHGSRESRHHTVKVSPWISLSDCCKEICILYTSWAQCINARVVSDFSSATQTRIQRAELFSLVANHELSCRSVLGFLVRDGVDSTDDILREWKVLKVIVWHWKLLKPVTRSDSTQEPHSCPLPRASLTVLGFHNHNLSFLSTIFSFLIYVTPTKILGKTMKMTAH